MPSRGRLSTRVVPDVPDPSGATSGLHKGWGRPRFKGVRGNGRRQQPMRSGLSFPRWVSIALIGLLAAGCVGVIPEAARQGIDPNFTFAELWANPDAARGRRVAFGGEVLQVTPGQQETEIEILQHPLRFEDRKSTRLNSSH